MTQPGAGPKLPLADLTGRPEHRAGRSLQRSHIRESCHRRDLATNLPLPGCNGCGPDRAGVRCDLPDLRGDDISGLLSGVFCRASGVLSLRLNVGQPAQHKLPPSAENAASAGHPDVDSNRSDWWRALLATSPCKRSSRTPAARRYVDRTDAPDDLPPYQKPPDQGPAAEQQRWQ